VSDILAKVYGFKLFVKSINPLFNHVVKNHSGRHKARLYRLHPTYVISFLRYGHHVKPFKLSHLSLFKLGVLNSLLAKLH